MWLSYDDMSYQWVVSGAWSERVSSFTAIVEEADMVYVSHPIASSWVGQGYDTMSGAMYAWPDTLMGDELLEPGEGELFRFEYWGPGVPCLLREDSSMMWFTNFFSDETFTYLPIMSTDWCDGPDEAMFP
jgi:hypothetical protein